MSRLCAGCAVGSRLNWATQFGWPSLCTRRSNRMAESNSDRWSYSKPPISGAQIRAARALLKWSVREFSDQCRISKSAITRGAGNGTPLMQARNLNTIRQVFEEHGIEFLGLDGVRLLAQPPELLPRAAISGEAADESAERNLGQLLMLWTRLALFRLPRYSPKMRRVGSLRTSQGCRSYSLA